MTDFIQVAQRGAQDDCTKFTVTDSGTGTPTSNQGATDVQEAAVAGTTQYGGKFRRSIAEMMRSRKAVLKR